MNKVLDLKLLANEQTDVFYKFKTQTIKDVKDILIWADNNGTCTHVTMLDIQKFGCGRVKSDKDFNTVLNLIDRSASGYLRIILRKKMNLFGILYDKKVIEDILEIAIRGIDVGNKEYFIMIYLEPKFLIELSKNYSLVRIGFHKD